MAFKQFALDERITVTVYKRRSSRSIRLTVAGDGQVRVSIPTWVPYQAGVKFARERQPWIAARIQPRQPLTDGAAIGKAHHLRLVPVAGITRPAGRLNGSEVVVKHPADMNGRDERVQARAEAAAIRALKAEAEQLLPQRLNRLAEQHGFTYGAVTVKQLKSRWGSCDGHGNITLNLFLMQLPWPLIDYVLLHELTHTRIMRHGPDFWDAMRPLTNDLSALRKAIRIHQPVLTGGVQAVA